MTHDELIAEARKQAEDFRDTGEPPISLDRLPNVRALDAVVVYFESDEHDGKIEVFLERETGKFLAATLIPAKPKKSA